MATNFHKPLLRRRYILKNTLFSVLNEHREVLAHIVPVNNGFFVIELKDVDVDDIWFQQDGATRHTASERIYLLKKTLADGIISRRGSVACPSRSCDLTQLDNLL